MGNGRTQVLPICSVYQAPSPSPLHKLTMTPLTENTPRMAAPRCLLFDFLGHESTA